MPTSWSDDFHTDNFSGGVNYSIVVGTEGTDFILSDNLEVSGTLLWADERTPMPILNLLATITFDNSDGDFVGTSHAIALGILSTDLSQGAYCEITGAGSGAAEMIGVFSPDTMSDSIAYAPSSAIVTITITCSAEGVLTMNASDAGDILTLAMSDALIADLETLTLYPFVEIASA